jgi:hypothetical protein
MSSPEPLAQDPRKAIEGDYVYARDNPLMSGDPSGADPCARGGGGCGYWDSPDAPCFPNCHPAAGAEDPTSGDEPPDLGEKDPSRDSIPWYKVWRPRHDTAVNLVANWLRMTRPDAEITTEVGVPNGSVNGNHGWADVIAWGKDRVEVWEVKHAGGAAEAAGDAQLAAYIKALQAKLIAEGDTRRVVAGGEIPELGPAPNLGNPREWITAKSGRSPGIVTYQVHKQEPPTLPKPIPLPRPVPVGERGKVPKWVKTRPLWSPPDFGPVPAPRAPMSGTEPNGPNLEWPHVSAPEPNPGTSAAAAGVVIIIIIIVLAPVGA